MSIPTVHRFDNRLFYSVPEDCDDADEPMPALLAGGSCEAEQSCCICMEDFPVSKLRQHNACDCIMCEPCLERTVEHSQQDSGKS